MAAGDVLLGDDGKLLLQADGKLHLSDGAGDECCCGAACLDGLDGYAGDSAFVVGSDLDVASSSYTLDWTAVGFAGDETSYTIESSPDNATWSTVATGLTGDDYRGTTAPDTTAYYRVVTVGGAATEYACSVRVATDRAPTLAAPHISEPVAGTYRIDLSYSDTGTGELDWRPNTAGEYDSVEIWSSSTEGGTYSFVAEVGAPLPAYYDDVDGAGWYRLRAVNYTAGSGQYAAYGIASPAATAS